MSLNIKFLPVILATLFLSSCGSGGGGDTPAPQLNVSAFEDYQLLENQTGAWQIDASSNQLNPISYSISGGPDASFFSISGNTLTFPTAANYEAPNDANKDSVYEVIVSTSSGSASAPQTIYVRIQDAQEAPIISTLSIGNIQENSISVATISASDEDRNSLISYSLMDSSGAKDENLLSIDSNGIITFLSAPNFESPTDYNSDNTIEFTVEVSDGTFSTQAEYSFAITDINESPAITTNQIANLSEGVTNVITVVASDQDAGSSLTYSLVDSSGLKDEALLVIDSSSGAITFITPPDFESPTDVGTNNTIEFSVAVSDGSLEVTQDLSFSITNINEAPSFSIASAQSYTENSGATISVSAVDQDASTSLSYSLSGADAAQFSISTSGVVSFTSAPDYESPSDSGSNNIYNISVGVSDGTNSSSVTLVISLTDDTSDNFGIKLPGKVALAELKKES